MVCQHQHLHFNPLYCAQIALRILPVAADYASGRNPTCCVAVLWPALLSSPELKHALKLYCEDVYK